MRLCKSKKDGKMKLKRFTKIIAFRVSPEMKQEMDDISLKMSMTEGEMIRDALYKYLKTHVKGLEVSHEP